MLFNNLFILSNPIDFMRKITNPKEKDKKQRRNQLILGGFLVFTIMLSTFAIVIDSLQNKTQNSIKYNGFKFESSNGYWVTSMGQYQFIFKSNPLETKNFSSSFVDIELNLVIDYANKPLYIYAQNSDASKELYQNLQYFVERYQLACFESQNCPQDLPVKDCTNNFIIYKISNTTSIKQQDNCVFIEGQQEDLVYLTDEFLFRILGIKQ